MTLEIFSTKWSSHVESVIGPLMRYLSKAQVGGDRAAIVSGVEIYKKCLEDVKIFEAEAEELGYKEEPLRGELAKDLAADLTARTDPFRDMEVMLAMIDHFTTSAKKSKSGRPVLFWPPWQALPLTTRRAINDLIEDFAEEKVQGVTQAVQDWVKKGR